MGLNIRLVYRLLSKLFQKESPIKHGRRSIDLSPAHLSSFVQAVLLYGYVTSPWENDEIFVRAHCCQDELHQQVTSLLINLTRLESMAINYSHSRRIYAGIFNAYSG